MNKPIIMQHIVAAYMNNGGPATGYNLLMNSHLKDKYNLVPLIQKDGSGINLKIVIDLVCQIKKVRPDIIHVRGLQSEGFYGLLAARIAGCKKVIVSVHGTSIDSLMTSRFKRIIYSKIIEPFTLKNASIVYCVCEYAAKRPYIVKNATKLYGYIHNVAPDYSNFDSDNGKRIMREKLGIGIDEIVVVSIGRISVEKGYDYLVKAIKLLAGKENIRFLIVGDGDYLCEIRNRLEIEIKSNKVILLGKRADVRDILFASDIFVFPTLHENLSNALLEACSAGLAVIATNVGGNPEVIQNMDTGILINPSDSVKLAEEILNLSMNSKLREYYGEKAILNVQTNFNQIKIFDQLSQLYDEILIN